ncbi:MAG: GIY-YIG nuclease family protein [Clostridium butyricum]|nr:GIY-YIG nuclease family protein [Clostridium butyricum]MDU3595601.1 GIY-YIG nuclease family protein [Clostridium butyricum]
MVNNNKENNIEKEGITTIKKIGIYKITNTITGKCYIGESFDIDSRLNRHQLELMIRESPLIQTTRRCG